MSILKLANAGDEATLEITGCEVVEGQYGEQVQFDAGDDRLYLPLASAQRQLERLGLVGDMGLDIGTIVGKKLIFSRTANPKPGAKPFWNIGIANGKPLVSKSAPPKTAPVSRSNVPDKDLPPLLRNQEAEDSAELYAKVSGKSDVPEPIQRQREAYATAQLQTLRIALQVLEPEYRKHEIGLTDDVCHKHSFELLKLWSDKGLI